MPEIPFEKMNPSRTVCAVEWTWQGLQYFSSFIAKSQMNDLEDIGQCQRSLHATHPLMVVVIYTKYGNNPSRTVCPVKRTQKCVPYFGSFNAKPWLNDLEDICQVQRSLCMTHPVMLVIIYGKYGKNPSRTVRAVEWTGQDVPYFSSFNAKSCLNDLEDIGQG